MRVAFWIDNSERFCFFKRFLSGFSQNNIIPVFFCTKPTIVRACKKAGIPYVFVRGKVDVSDSGDRYVYFDEKESLKTLDYIQGYLSVENIQELSLRIQSSIYDYTKNNRIDYFFVWNGTKVSGRTIKKLSDKNLFKTCFLELSNFPGRVFADSKGVNAESFLYEYLSKGGKLLDLIEDRGSSEQSCWLNEYFDYKNKPLPQIKYAKSLDLGFLINYLASVFRFSVVENDLTLLKRVKNKLGTIKGLNKTLGVEVDLEEQSYVFLALQVTTDSQIKINSDVDNFDAINYAINYARKKGLVLYVKPHPSEMDFVFLDELEHLSKKESGFFIVRNNTVDLISKADSVVVINSTVGMEAIVLGKEVEILGRALYSFINKDEMSLYINKYLVNGVEYFSDKDIEFSCFKRIIALSDFQCKLALGF